MPAGCLRERVEGGQLARAADEGAHRARQLGRGRGRRRGRWRTRDVEQRRILLQDRDLEVAQRRTRVDPELVGEPAPDAVQRGERVGLATAPVEGQHQLGVDPLVERVLAGQPGQLPDQLRVLAQRQRGVDPGQLPPQPQAVQPGHLVGQAGHPGQVGQRLAAPQRQRVGEVTLRVGRAGRDGALDQRLRELDVDRAGVEVQHVAGARHTIAPGRPAGGAGARRGSAACSPRWPARGRPTPRRRGGRR
jgi:hypothetical protein